MEARVGGGSDEKDVNAMIRRRIGDYGKPMVRRFEDVECWMKECSFSPE